MPDLRRIGLLVRAALAAVLLLAGALYLTRLGDAPINVAADEARFAIQAHALATTGRDINGTRTPLFFHIVNPLDPTESSIVWWQPTLFYITAFVFRLVGFSQWSARLPIAALAILNVWLMSAIGRRLFSHAWYGVLAALLLTLTPAHMVFGRQAMDYFCPMPIALIWFWCLLLWVETDRAWMPFVTGLVLGAGLYTYISSWVVMPFYFVITQIVLWLSGKPFRANLAVAAGFAVPLLALTPWLWLHPTMPREILADYRAIKGLRLGERIDVYWDYFNPSYLFFSGGSNPMFATSKAGVFALAFIALLPLGIWSVWRQKFPLMRTVVLIAFFFAPVPIAAALPTDPKYFTPRDLLAIPFGVLIAVAGVEWLMKASRPAMRMLAAVLLLSIPIQFVPFVRDYFADYQVRSAKRFDVINFREVARSVIAADRVSPVPAVYLSDDMREDMTVKWKFYLLANRRPDLWARTKYLRVAPFTPAEIPAGSILVVNAKNARLDDLVGPSRCAVAAVVHDLSGEPTATVLRKN